MPNVLVYGDRIKETTSTSGTGPYSLDGAQVGFTNFLSLGSGNQTGYCCSYQNLWEVGIGIITSGNLARGQILASSSNNAIISWPTGVKDIFCTLIASQIAATKSVSFKVFDDNDLVILGSGITRWRVPNDLDRWSLTDISSHVYTASTSGNVSVQIYNERSSQNMLSTMSQIDVSGKDSANSSIPFVINSGAKMVNAIDILRIDVSGAGVNARGLELALTFQKLASGI